MAVKAGSKTARILEHLEDGKTISSLHAFREYDVTRLASIVFNLRMDGHNIVTVRKTSNTGIRYAEYHIPQE